MYTCAKIFSTIQIGCRCQCLACHEPTPNERTEQTINTSKWKFSAKPWQMHVIQSIHACICNTTMYNLSKQCASRWRPICCPLVVPFQVSCSSAWMWWDTTMVSWVTLVIIECKLFENQSWKRPFFWRVLLFISPKLPVLPLTIYHMQLHAKSINLRNQWHAKPVTKN